MGGKREACKTTLQEMRETSTPLIFKCKKNVRNTPRPHPLPQHFGFLQHMLVQSLHRAKVFMALILQPFKPASSVPAKPHSGNLGLYRCDNDTFECQGCGTFYTAAQVDALRKLKQTQHSFSRLFGDIDRVAGTYESRAHMSADVEVGDAVVDNVTQTQFTITSIGDVFTREEDAYTIDEEYSDAGQRLAGRAKFDYRAITIR
jgi:hypothetical protein